MRKYCILLFLGVFLFSGFLSLEKRDAFINASLLLGVNYSRSRSHVRRTKDQIVSDRKALKAALDKQEHTIASLAKAVKRAKVTIWWDVQVDPGLYKHKNLIIDRRKKKTIRRTRAQIASDYEKLKNELDKTAHTGSSLAQAVGRDYGKVIIDVYAHDDLYYHPNFAASDERVSDEILDKKLIERFVAINV